MPFLLPKSAFLGIIATDGNSFRGENGFLTRLMIDRSSGKVAE
jgi:hypothetical protein